MLPIVQFPAMAGIIDGFESLSYQQKQHAKAYTTGLLLSQNKTITGISSMVMESKGYRSLNRFLMEYEWDAKEMNSERLKELQRHNETRWGKEGVLIIDDTLIEKTGKDIDCVSKFYDHAKGRFILGHDLVTLHYADHKTSYPIEQRLYIPEGQGEFKTKIKLALEMMDYACTLGVPASTVVFDCWFLCQEVTNTIESKGMDWVSRLKSNRLVLFGGRNIHIEEFAKKEMKFRTIELEGKKHEVHMCVKQVSKLGKVRVLISRNEEGEIYLVTNRLDWNAEKILSSYMLRSRVETFYRDAKQHLGLEECEMRKSEGIQRHWYLVFLSHTLARLGVCESVLGRCLPRAKSICGELKGVVFEALQAFVSWVIHNWRLGTEEIMRVMFLNRQS